MKAEDLVMEWLDEKGYSYVRDLPSLGTPLKIQFLVGNANDVRLWVEKTQIIGRRWFTYDESHLPTKRASIDLRHPNALDQLEEFLRP